jgi:regulator of chromosome condensation
MDIKRKVILLWIIVMEMCLLQITLSVTHPSHVSVVGCTLTLGTGDTGQLGLGEDILDRTRPALVDIGAEIVQIAAGGMHTACLSKDGKVYTFGCNDEGALGRSTPEEEDYFKPGVVELDATIVQISAGALLYLNPCISVTFECV